MAKSVLDLHAPRGQHALTMLSCVRLRPYLSAETLGNKDLKKKMSPTNAKALNTMRQRIKKHNSGEEMGQLVQKYRWGLGANNSSGLVFNNSQLHLSTSPEQQQQQQLLGMEPGRNRHSLLTGCCMRGLICGCAMLWLCRLGRTRQRLLMMMSSRRRSPAAAAVRVRWRRERRGRLWTSAQVRGGSSS